MGRGGTEENILCRDWNREYLDCGILDCGSEIK